MKKETAFLLAFILLFTAFAGCAPKDASGTTTVHGTTTDPGSSTSSTSTAESIKHLNFASLEWTGVDTYQLTGTQNFQGFTLDSLLLYQPDGTFTTNIAEKFSVSEDGKTFTITIPTDFKYHDGTPLIPEDVKRSYERGLEISPYNEDYADISSIEVQGNDVIIHLDTYSSSTLFSIAGGFMPIISVSQLDSMSAEELLWGARPYAPYYIDSYVEGSHIELKRNEYYKTNNPNVKNKGPMHVETITVRFINDDFAMTNSIVASEIDASYTFSAAMLSELSKNSAFTYMWERGFQVTRLSFNNDYELFGDPKVREALLLLVDRDGLSEYSEGEMSPAYSFSVDGMIDFSVEAHNYIKERYSFQPDKAAKLLADAGWSDSDGDGYLDKGGKTLTFTINFISSSYFKMVAEYLQARMREFGVLVEVQGLERAVFNTERDSDAYQAFIAGFSWGDTSSTLPYLVPDTNIFPDDTYFTMCYEAAANPNDDARVQQFGEAQKLFVDSLYCTPIIRRNYLFVYNQVKLKDAIVDDYGIFYINDIK